MSMGFLAAGVILLVICFYNLTRAIMRVYKEDPEWRKSLKVTEMSFVGFLFMIGGAFLTS